MHSLTTEFLDATSYLFEKSCPSVSRSVGPYYFQMTNMPFYEHKNSLNDIIINDTMSVDEVVASNNPAVLVYQ